MDEQAVCVAELGVPFPKSSYRCHTGRWRKHNGAHAVILDLVVVFHNSRVCIIEVEGCRTREDAQADRERFIREELNITVPLCRVRFNVKREWDGKVCTVEQAVWFDEQSITEQLLKARGNSM